MQLDLGDFESVVACAETIRSLNTPIDMLICNAVIVRGHNHPYNVPMAKKLMQVSGQITAEYLVDQEPAHWKVSRL